MQVCKQCGKGYFTDQPLCPECTNRYNEVYNRSNLTDNFKGKRRSTGYRKNRSIVLVISFTLSILFLLYFIASLGAVIAGGKMNLQMHGKEFFQTSVSTFF